MTISAKMLENFSERFKQDKSNLSVAGAIAKVGIDDASFNSAALRRHNYEFSLETAKGDITNQESSGRCWMFSALNAARVDLMKRLNLETFEFSQNYSFFWDKLEKSNYFLENILETLELPSDSRLIAHLLTEPVQDGGQWDMYAGLLEKYGAVPKSMMPETFSSSNSKGLCKALTRMLRGFACELRTAFQAGQSRAELAARKDDMLYALYNVLVKALGEPPTRFTFEYRDKEDQFHRLHEMSPQDFFQTYVGWNLDEKICLINAPTADKPYGRVYTVKYLGSVKEGRPIRYLNVPVEVLKEAAIAQIKDGYPVWFGCDVGQMSCRLNGYGLLDEQLYNYKDTLGTGNLMDKAQRLEYGESLLTHAMVFIGVNLDDKGQPLTWKVENSWGKKSGREGYYSMSDGWFNEYNYQIMVDRRYVPTDWLKGLEQPVIELEPWDPMGALARVL